MRLNLLTVSSLIQSTALIGLLVGCQPQTSAPPTIARTSGQIATDGAAPNPARAPESVNPQAVSPSSTQPDPSEPDSAPTDARRIVEQCKISMAKVNDPDLPLNVRSTPDTTRKNIVGTIENNRFVTVINEQNGWFEISDPIQGWIAKSRTDSNCNTKIERVQFAKNQDSISIRDRFVGTGTHVYRLNLAKGQNLSVISEFKGLMPAIYAPDGTQITPIANNSDQWSGTLNVSGDYRFELDSNYKGYRYSFHVQAR